MSIGREHPRKKRDLPPISRRFPVGNDRWDRIVLNETHPKVLYYALTGEHYSFPGINNQMVDWLQDTTAVPAMPNSLTDHAWDAAISAWVTYQGYKTGFSPNLMSKANNPILPTGEVNYYWPK